MTTRWWMVAVALVALLMATVLEIGREWRLACRYRGWAQAWSDVLRVCGGRRADQREVAYWAYMKRKYEYAASHPWLPVEPDSPEPG